VNGLDPGAGGWENMYELGNFLNDFFFPNTDWSRVGINIGATTPPSLGTIQPTNLGFVGPIAAGIGLPELGFPPADDTEGATDPDDSLDAVVDEDFPQTIFTPGGAPAREPMSDADWERVYDEYVILNPEPQMAVDWGDFFGDIAQGAITGWLAPEQAGITGTGLVGGSAGGAYAGPAPVAGPAGQAAMSGGGCCPTGAGGGPKYGRICLATGAVTPIRRKRRKALLTNGDFNDLMRIASLPNKETVRVALASALR